MTTQMTRTHVCIAVVTLTTVLASPIHRIDANAAAGSPTVSAVYNTWDFSTVVGQSRVVRTADGLNVSMQTSTLPPGQAVTLWIGVFNNPSACAMRPCGADDIGNPAVQADFLWATGHVVGESGRAGLAGRLPVGDASASLFNELGVPEAAVGLTNPWTAEVQLLVHAHGPAQTGQMLRSQLTSFLGGCETFLPAIGAVATDPSHIPDQVGECSTFQISIHE
jgi:hypothetical protein